MELKIRFDLTVHLWYCDILDVGLCICNVAMHKWLADRPNSMH